MVEISGARCLYTELPDGVHQFTFHETSREAVDEWTNHLEQLQLAHKWYGKGIVRLMLDARAGSLPIRYLFECLSDYNREYAELTPPHVRMAYVYGEESQMLSIFASFADLMPVPTRAAFFKSEEFDKALGWLKTEEN